MDQFGQCIFTDVTIELPQTRFRPQSDNSSFVTVVGFLNSHIQVFSRDICDEFAELKTLRLHDLGIKQVTQDAFENCKELTQLTFYSGNRIKEFNFETFWPLTKLTALDLEGNRLEELHFGWFRGLVNLRDLHLQNNRLKNIAPYELEELPGLKYMYLHNNKFLILGNIDQILINMPNLVEISFYGNPLPCARVEELIEIFNDENINAVQRFEELPSYYDPRRVQNISCLTDTAWVAARQRQ